MKKTGLSVLMVALMLLFLMPGAAISGDVSVNVLWEGDPLIEPVDVAVSPDGETIYISDYGTHSVYSMPAAGGEPALLASGGNLYHLRGIAVSPDGETLYIASWKKNMILKLPASGGTPEVLTSGSPLQGPHDLVVSHDGQTLYIVDHFARIVVSLPATGGSPTILASGDVFGSRGSGPIALDLSPDGDMLYLKTSEKGILALPVEGGKPATLIESPLVTHGGIAVSFDENTFYSVNSEGCNGGESQFFSYSFDSVGKEVLYSGLPFYGSGLIDMSPDGTKVYAADTGYREAYPSSCIGYQPGRIIEVDLHQQPADITVSIDIKPGSCPNPVNLNSRGVLPVAVLGSEGLDVEDIDPATITIAGVSPLRHGFDDVAAPYGYSDGLVDAQSCTTDGADGYMDLTLKFDKQELTAAIGEVEDGEVITLTLAGRLVDEAGGNSISGEDLIVILDKGKKK